MSKTQRGTSAEVLRTLTPNHRIVWKDPKAPRGVEMGLWMDKEILRTDIGFIVAWSGPFIVRVIEPSSQQPDPTWWADEREAAFSRSGALGRIIACTITLVVGLVLGALLHGVLGG